jgi:excisionase family DNA binding protein
MTRDINDNGIEFLTTAQAARILNMSVITLKKFITQGKLKALRTPGGHYRIRRDDLTSELFLNNGYEPVAKGEK